MSYVTVIGAVICEDDTVSAVDATACNIAGMKMKRKTK
jgi:hypothetical protein